MKKRKIITNRVYSTELGKVCPVCDRQLNKCNCKKCRTVEPNDGFVRLMRQTKGKKGKGVTLITGLPLQEAELKKLAKTLKKKCGCGGCIKGHVIEIQGDKRDSLEQILTTLGYKVKQAGG